MIKYNKLPKEYFIPIATLHAPVRELCIDGVTMATTYGR